MDQYESSVKRIPFPQERVYAKLEDLNNLEAIKDKLPADKVKDFKYSRDEASANIPPLSGPCMTQMSRMAQGVRSTKPPHIRALPRKEP